MRPRILVAALIAASFALASACVDGGNVNLGTDCERGFCDDSPGFTPPADGGDADATLAPELLACVATECPEPYATCESSRRCAVNLLRDSNNCGACGVVCRGIEDLNLAVSCVDGACAYQCSMSTDGRVFRNCNVILDDGCETDIWSDPANCGMCGHACAPGTACIEGFCGCFPPMIPCNGECVDVSGDDDNCNECGNKCEAPSSGCSPMPPNSKYGCAEGQCDRLKCKGRYGDCNFDMGEGCSSDGCETDLTTVDNCGGCGVACGPEQECRQVGIHLQCKDLCEKSGRTKCDDECFDLLTDPKRCGACTLPCNGARANQTSVCRKGLCGASCLEGFADCNGDPSDGCEVDVNSHAGNCGGCGRQCDLAAGQPCIEGKCLMVGCDGGVVTK